MQESKANNIIPILIILIEKNCKLFILSPRNIKVNIAATPQNTTNIKAKISHII